MRMVSLFYGAMAVSCISAAHAETDRGLAGCMAIDNAVNRLACFDELAKSRKAVKQTDNPPTRSQWAVRVETSAIDDSKNVMMSVQSINEFSGKYGNLARASMNVACRENSTDVYFIFGDYFMSDHQEWGRATLRIDKNPAFSSSMKESTDNGALGLWNGTGVSLLKSIFGKSKLLVRVTPFNESQVTAEFPIAGLEESIKTLRAACRW
jgi:type VI secretion system protein VasI